MTFDGYWEMNMERQAQENEHVQNVGFWCVLDKNGEKFDNSKHVSSSAAKEAFVGQQKINGLKTAEWKNFENMCYYTVYINVADIKAKIRQFNIT